MSSKTENKLGRDLKSLADQLGIDGFTETSQAAKHLTKQIFQQLHTHGGNKLKDQKVEGAFEAVLGYPMLAADSATPLYLKGPGGHGKSTIVKMASKTVADAMGLKFIENPPQNYQGKSDEFCYYNLNLGGMISNLKQSLPYVDESSEGNDKVLKNAVNSIISGLQTAGGSTVNLDDFENCSNNVQNSMMEFMLSRTFEHIDLSDKGCYVAASANLGAALDGAKTFEASTPLLGRATVLYTADKLEHFVDRAKNKYKDHLGDAYISEFLEINKELFFYLPESKNKRHLSPSPRNWDRVTKAARDALHEFNHTGVYPYDSVRREIAGSCGQPAALRHDGFIVDFINGAAITSRKFADNEELTKDEIKKMDACLNHASGTPQIGSDGQLFSMLFPKSLADYTIMNIERDKKAAGHFDESSIRKRIDRMVTGFYDTGLINGQASRITEGWVHFSSKIVDTFKDTDFTIKGESKFGKEEYRMSHKLSEILTSAVAELPSGNANTIVKRGEMKEDIMETTFKEPLSNFYDKSKQIKEESELQNTLAAASPAFI
jgi:MoxR-like ATPase